MQQLHDFLDHWPTDVGRAFVGERAVLHNQDLLNDLADLEWMGLHFYAVTGRRADENKLRMMMNVWTGCSYPDPRIWNNRISALAGTARSTASLALGAATAVSEATIYGHRANKKCIHMLLRAHQAVTAGQDLEDFINTELEAGRKFYGYGRPTVNSDERIAPLVQLLKQFNLWDNEFIQLTFKLNAHLENKKNLTLNLTGLCAGIGAMLELDPIEYHAFLTPAFNIGFMPCYLDALKKPQGTLFPIPCERIHFKGNRRAW